MICPKFLFTSQPCSQTNHVEKCEHLRFFIKLKTKSILLTFKLCLNYRQTDQNYTKVWVSLQNPFLLLPGLWVMPYPYWRCTLVLEQFFGSVMWSGIVLHPLIWLCLLRKVYWGRKCGNRWRQPGLSKISWWIFGLKTYLHLSSWPVQFCSFFLFFV